MGRPVAVRPGEIAQLFEPSRLSRGGLPAHELDGLRSQLVDAQNVRGDQGEIQPLRTATSRGGSRGLRRASTSGPKSLSTSARSTSLARFW